MGKNLKIIARKYYNLVTCNFFVTSQIHSLISQLCRDISAFFAVLFFLLSRLDDDVDIEDDDDETGRTRTTPCIGAFNTGRSFQLKHELPQRNFAAQIAAF